MILALPINFSPVLFRLIVEDLKDHKPRINSRSERLAKARRVNRNIWEHLYKLAKESRKRQNISYNTIKEKEDEDNMKECTFKPKITEHKLITPEIAYKRKGDIYTRATQWKRNRDNKRQRKKDLKENEEERECVFTPNINPRRCSFFSGEMKGVEVFVERQKVARENKERAKPKNIASNWVRRITIPKEFTFFQRMENSRSTINLGTSISKKKFYKFPIKKQINFEQVKRQLHKKLHTLNMI